MLKQSDNQYKMAVLIAEQLSILSFCQDNQISNATYYDRFTTRVEVACQAGVCYHSPDLLEEKATELKMVAYDTLLPAEKKRWLMLSLSGNVGNMSATCRPDSQMSALLADISLSWRYKTIPDTVFLCRGLPTFTPFFLEYQRYIRRIPL